MPFRSEKQRRYLWKNHPKIARDWTDEHGSKPQPTKKAKGGSAKKNGPVRPIDIPWDAEKKKAVGGSVKKRKPWGDYNPDTDQPRPRPNPFGKKKKKHHFKAGGTMEPYRGSYISGKVDGKMLSNPSLRKYYKGLI